VIDEAGLNIGPLRPGITFENGFEAIAGGEHSQDAFNREAAAADDGLAVEDLGVDGDSGEEFGFVHGVGSMHATCQGNYSLSGKWRLKPGEKPAEAGWERMVFGGARNPD